MDNEFILKAATFLTERNTLIAILYVIVVMWIVSWAFQRAKIKKLLEHCEELQQQNVYYVAQLHEKEDKEC